MTDTKPSFLARRQEQSLQERNSSADRLKRALDFLTLLALLGTAGVSAYGIRDAHETTTKQYEAMRDQLTEMRAEQRPWAQVTHIEIEGLSVTKNTVAGNARIFYRNGGKQPARAVNVISSLVDLREEQLHVFSERADECDLHRPAAASIFHDSVLFPSEQDASINTSLNLPQTYIEPIRKSWVNAQEHKLAREIALKPELHQQIETASGYAPFGIRGCIRYLSSDDQNPKLAVQHTTTFFAILRYPAPNTISTLQPGFTRDITSEMQFSATKAN